MPNFIQIGLGISVTIFKVLEKGYQTKPKSKVSTPIFPKTAIFGPHFDGT